MAGDSQAPGAPGIDARWAPGPKDGVGTACSESSNVWFTIGHGILNEVFYPQVDTPSIRDLGLIITDGDEYFSDEASSSNSKVAWEEKGIPAFHVTNKSHDGKYVVKKTVISDPKRPVILQQIFFEPHNTNYHLYALLAPHLGDMGGNNSAWLDNRNGTPLLIAKRDNCVLALASSSPLVKYSAGFVGVSDGWQDLNSNKQMTLEYDRADNGDTALTAEIDYSNGEFILGLGFGSTVDEAIDNVLESLRQNFDEVYDSYVSGWKEWLETCGAKIPDDSPPLAHKSLTTLKIHQSKNPSGGIVAGLASPWGYAKGDDAKIGYHVIWTRDMVESAGGMLAAGAHESVKNMLRLLKNTQQIDGHWPQNMWIDGTPFWNGVQMDETALPILLVNMAKREGALTEENMLEIWPMVRKASSYLLKNGPVTQQDRWEEDPGYTPFTLSTEIAALLAAADLAELAKEPIQAKFMRETADTWYDNIDSWLYASGTDWCKQYAVDGYYERIASVNGDEVNRFQNIVHVKNVPSDEAYLKAVHLISPDALALVRFGLRSANDSKILDTVKIIDKFLKIDTPNGTTWHRYNDDGYGEHEDGSAFDGTGIGRGWPLLTGERAHYELALGHSDTAEKLKSDMESFCGDGGLLPEQVWDSDPIAEHELKLGRPTGSAMPLAWAHGEYLKLIRSINDGKIFDCPPQTIKRYLEEKTTSPLKSWRFNHKIHTIPNGKKLRIETLAPATIHWSNDNWKSTNDDATTDTGLGVHFIDIEPNALKDNKSIIFTFYWHHADKWEGRDFKVVSS